MNARFTAMSLAALRLWCVQHGLYTAATCDRAACLQYVARYLADDAAFWA